MGDVMNPAGWLSSSLDVSSLGEVYSVSKAVQIHSGDQAIISVYGQT